jgi:hypothetical protein
MEKKFTLMKTLTAFLDLLFPRRRKNSRAINSTQTSTTGGCGTTPVNNRSMYMNDPDTSGSFLFFNQALDGQQSTDNGQQAIDKDEQLKSKEDPESYRGKINDELALGSSPKPVYKSWKERVNDDLAACTAVDDPLLPPLNNSYKRKNENINVDHIFTISNTIKRNTNTTRTNKNGACLPFASFSFFVRRSFSEGGSFFSMIVSNVLKSLSQDEPSKNLKPIFIPLPLRDKTKNKIS